MKSRILVLTCLFLFAFGSSAFAAPTYATSVLGYSPATGVSPNRADASNALDAPDPIISSSGINFVSLGMADTDGDGYGGSIVLGFGTNFKGWATIYETTYEPREGYNEYADVFGWNVATKVWDFLGSVTNQSEDSSAYDGYTFNFADPAAIYSQMMIRDTTLANSGANGDGFDVNAVQVNATPIPGAVWLLGTGLIGLVGIRRRFVA